MTTQQTDIEKTLKRILARELKEWPLDAQYISQDHDGECFTEKDMGFVFCAKNICTRHRKYGEAYPSRGGKNIEIVTRSQWEAERALLASEQAQPLGDSEEFDQALWDKVASESMSLFTATVQITKADVTYSFVAETACNAADAFMAERAKRIAARKAVHD